MIGRVEITEILGMAASCAVLLFAGFSVETLEGTVGPAWATVEVGAPDVPDAVGLPEEIRLELPHLVQPVRPAPPPVSLDEGRGTAMQPYRCVCGDAVS